MTSQPESDDRPAYKPLPEDWRKAVAIVAHPDDMEFGAAAAVARWTRQGKEVVYVMVTSGEAGIDGIEPEECRTLREREQVESARIVGVDTVEFLGFPDGVVEYGIPLRKAISEVVRRHQPEIVITGNFRDTFGPGALNQADHIAVGRAVIDGVRDAANRWIHTDQLSQGLEKWGGVSAVWAAGSPGARHAVDTTDTFQLGVLSLQAHRAYIDGLGWDDFDEEEMLEGFCRPIGSAIGTTYGTSFEVYSLTWGGDEDA
ncbi:PIG-L deacetylase family protein [Nocardioides marmoribigeumensis]|uniref:LmbE family N-acetylglucosaminyl deacetylase n=1 Tax=Nocardioides marmoribigeumensis TaxID=433649 RepID=A0ABU2BQF6_9ACTN|nr:PIG-L deacetylase family protein [Nocardioides marmoribigeumensis]MDR7360843.1 LmbE family N-acetylglucosaminyl deacetylase [Nocardioides marmoribigeumensis]